MFLGPLIGHMRVDTGGMPANHRILYRVLLGIWAFIGLGALLVSFSLFREQSIPGKSTEVGGLFLVGALFLFAATLLPLIGYGLILRGVRSGGILVIIPCAVPLPPLLQNACTSIVHLELPIAAVPVVFLGFNVWLGLITAFPQGSTSTL